MGAACVDTMLSVLVMTWMMSSIVSVIQARMNVKHKKRAVTMERYAKRWAAGLMMLSITVSGRFIGVKV